MKKLTIFFVIIITCITVVVFGFSRNTHINISKASTNSNFIMSHSDLFHIKVLIFLYVLSISFLILLGSFGIGIRKTVKIKKEYYWLNKKVEEGFEFKSVDDVFIHQSLKSPELCVN